jgi:hypothetical protein
MKDRLLKNRVPALALTAALAAMTAFALAETSRRPIPPRRSPVSRLQANPGRYSSSTDSRSLRNLIEDLENSSPEEVRSGRIDRFFTDPAVIITNGEMHHIDWSRVRDDRPIDRQRDDPNADPRDRADQRDADARDRAAPPNADARDRAAQRNADVQIESFETRRIDPRTMVVMYTAVLPGADGVIRQPVVATVVREPGRSGWRVASYTAENAAIPGVAPVEDTNQDRLPAR